MRIAMASVFLAVGMAACEVDHYPLRDPGVPPPPPAPPPPPSATIRGRLCEIFDLTERVDCRPAENSELIVSTLITFATADADGTFAVASPEKATTIAVVAVANDDWFGSTVFVSLDAGGAARGVEIPVMRRALVEEIVANSSAPLAEGSSIFAVQVDRAGVPAASVAFEPVDGVQPRYDAGERTYLPGNGTGPLGTAVYVDLDPTLTGYDIPYGDATAPHMVHLGAFAETLALTRVQLAP
ncbi:MAG: hypothetical protein D6689_09900 [Deltaproteobacteria bacterium]|nr:MAG: hypothetical protein D6689_09900 [Deltaproteobacteria bacterium]